nr:cytidylate kinase family protein [uncultured Draconibacterium sp.]
MNKLHISITGDLGSGKSSVAKEICKKLDYTFLSTGLLQREVARNKGMNTLELNEFSKKNREVDDYLDNKLIELNNSMIPHVLDSRLAWHFVSKSFKVLLLALPEVAAERILRDNERTDEPGASSIEEKISDSNLRRQLENERFKELYGIDCEDYKNYDLIVDSSFAGIKEVVDLIIDCLVLKQQGKEYYSVWLGPKRIFPTEHIRKLVGSKSEKIVNGILLGKVDYIHPIQVVVSEGDFFVWDGHKNLSAAIKEDKTLIPVEIMGVGNDEIHSGHSANLFVRSALNLSLIHDWESFHNFRFKSYPRISDET